MAEDPLGDSKSNAGEELELDPPEHYITPELSQKLSSKKRTVANILKSYVGAGVLAIPYAFAQGGIIVRPICHDWIKTTGSALYSFGTDTLRWIGVVDSGISFEDVGHSLFGWWGRFLVDQCLLSSQLGFCVVYQIFLGDTIHGLLPRIPKLLCILVPVPLLLALCQIRRLKWLAATSFVALMVFCFGFIVTLYFSIHRPSFAHAKLDLRPQSMGSFATLISFAVFSFEGIGLVLPLENSVRPDITPIFSKLFSVTVGFVAIVYALVGSLGYVAFGNAVASSLLDNVIEEQQGGKAAWMLNLVIVGFLVGGFCSYPLNLYPVTLRLETHWKLSDTAGNDIPGVYMVFWKRTFLRMGLVMLALALALAIPSFGLFIALIGSLFSTSLAFVFPTLFHMKMFTWPKSWPSGPLNLGMLRESDFRPTQKWSMYLAVFIDIIVFIFGISATIVCTIVSLQNIATAIRNGTISWSFQTIPKT